MDSYKTILEQLLKLPGSMATSDPNQIRIFCPKCHNIHPKAKLYVGVMKGSNLLGYDCKYCPYSGKVDKDFLNQFNISAEDYLKDVQTGKKPSKTVNLVTDLVKLNLKIPNYIRTEDKDKIDYLQERLQKKITIKDIQEYKIVLDFLDFFRYNNYDYLQNVNDNYQKEQMKNNAEEYSKYFVGMLSVDNNKINLRNLGSKKINRRYMVHVIDKTIGNPYMYMPDIPIDIMCTNPTINMAEGNYDIIGARELFFDKKDFSNVFVAIGTKKAYKRVLDQVLRMTCFLNANINIFADNDDDSNLNFYKDMFRDYRSIFPEITVFYNTKSKDFGDLREPIEVKRCKI